jgi:hypothetical protein
VPSLLISKLLKFILRLRVYITSGFIGFYYSFSKFYEQMIYLNIIWLLFMDLGFPSKIQAVFAEAENAAGKLPTATAQNHFVLLRNLK